MAPLQRCRALRVPGSVPPLLAAFLPPAGGLPYALLRSDHGLALTAGSELSIYIADGGQTSCHDRFDTH